MKDFDKIFLDKLYNHRTAPPAGIWDQLEDGLEGERRKKRKAFFWRIAAAVSLLLVAGSLVWVNIDTREGADVAGMKNVQEGISTEDFKHEKNDQMALNEESAQINKEPLEQLKQEASAPIEHLEEIPADQSEVNNKVSPQLAKAQENRPERSADNVSEVLQIKPLTPDPIYLDIQQMAVLVTEGPQNPASVTIIYKPGEASGNVLNQPDLNKSSELLTDLKNNGISFSEIRSAKSELLAKVFNKIDNGISRIQY